jgi:hypothetical protein
MESPSGMILTGGVADNAGRATANAMIMTSAVRMAYTAGFRGKVTRLPSHGERSRARLIRATTETFRESGKIRYVGSAEG